ncbi:uncharacterized protein L201_006872 [Kwoniella dendrophila CBS 6074]|uniref:Uncharacterized protein n=1 Tax=Kwoniella dendrophila CBS 6074 TaxID=1295534 RepID=A0AAX4K544_9TREE
MSMPSAVHSLAQEFRESKGRRNGDLSGSASPHPLSSGRRGFSLNAKYDRIGGSNRSGRKVWQEMTAKRQAERLEKEQALRAKMGLGEIRQTRKNDIWDKGYVQKKPPSLADLDRTKAAPPPAWLQAAAARSDVTGLMGAYAKKNQAKAAAQAEEELYAKYQQNHNSFRESTPSLNSHPYHHQQYIPYNQHDYIPSLQQQGFRRNSQTSLPLTYSQVDGREKYHHPIQYQPQTSPSFQPSFQQAQHNNQQQPFDHSLYPSSNRSTQFLLPRQSNNFLQPFNGYLPDATSTPQHNISRSQVGNHISSDATDSQEPFYPSSTSSYVGNTILQNHPHHAEHPDPTVQRHPNYVQQSSQTRDNGHRVRFQPVPQYFEISPAESSVPTLQGTANGPPFMNSVPTQGVHQTYQDLQSHVPHYNQAQLAHSHQTSNQVNPDWVPQVSVQNNALPVGLDNGLPPQLQRVHQDIVALRQGKRRKQEEDQRRPFEHKSLSKAVIEDLEKIADETVDELDLLRPELLSIEDEMKNATIGPDYMSQSSKRKRSNHDPNSHSQHNNSTYHHNGQDYQDSSTDDCDSPDTDTSSSSPASMTDDETYFPSTPNSSSMRPYRSKPPKHGIKGRGQKRRRLTYQAPKYLQDHSTNKRVRFGDIGYRSADDIEIDYDTDEDEEEEEIDEVDTSMDPEDYDDYEDYEEYDESMEGLPVSGMEREPKPVKPLSTFADNVIIPSNLINNNDNVKRQAKSNAKKSQNKTDTRRNTNPFTNKKRKFRALSNSQIDAPGEEIEGFSDEDEDELMENWENDEIVLSHPENQNQQQQQQQAQHSNQSQQRGSNRKWLKSYEDQDKLSTVEEEDEGDIDIQDFINHTAYNEKDQKDRPEKKHIGQEQEQVQFWGNGGELGFRIWRDAY